VWIRLGTYIEMLEDVPELYTIDGRWVELLTDPPDPKPYSEVEVSADVTPGNCYWAVTEDITDIAVSLLRVTADGCQLEPWVNVSKGVFAPHRQTEKIRLAFALAGFHMEPAPRFLSKRLLRAPLT
jgi:hypothetical protein